MRHYHRRNNFDDDDSSNASEQPCSGFWLLNILGGILVFFLGMRFAVKRTPLLPIILYRFLRGFAHR